LQKQTGTEMKAKILVIILTFVVFPIGQLFLSSCTKCQQAQNYSIVSAIAEAHKITVRDELGFFSDRMSLGAEVRWDSLVVFLLPQIQLVSNKEENKGLFIQSAYACDPGISSPTQQVTGIKISFDKPITIDGVVYPANSDLSEFFMVFDFFLGEEFPVSQYLDQNNKQMVLQGMFFSPARAFDSNISGTIDIEVELDGASIVGSQTVPITIKTTL
jgi:hypothetical protein